MNNEKFSAEILELQKEFNFGVQIKKMYPPKAEPSRFDFFQSDQRLYREILTALGHNPNFESYHFKENSYNTISNDIPLYFPCAVANKIAKMLLQLPIEQRLCFLEWAKKESDKANVQAQEWKMKNPSQYFADTTVQ